MQILLFSMNNLSAVVLVCLVYPPVGVLYEPFIGPTRLSSHSQLVDFITLGFFNLSMSPYICESGPLLRDLRFLLLIGNAILIFKCCGNQVLLEPVTMM